MRNLIRLLLAIATIIGCISLTWFFLWEHPVWLTVGDDGCCPCCGAPLPDKLNRCFYCDTRLIWRNDNA